MQMEATDPRDRIYSLLDIAGDISALQIVPNYQHSVQQVYTDAAREILKKGRWYFLLFCHERKLQSLPSWVPDWTASLTGPWDYGLRFSASGSWRDTGFQPIHEPSSWSLKVTAIRVSTIRICGTPWTNVPEGHQSHAAVNAAKIRIQEVQELVEQSPINTTAEVQDAIANIPIAGIINHKLAGQQPSMGTATSGLL
ncbi:hypothetical protein DL98DRAFT_534855 [Cadophora sp. DSE1049]|nr:hypothetical protein DL98DRAFT_534855 [Cadophora sp. DSE1049]